MDYETIDVTVADGYARIMLNRPDSLNSFNGTMHVEFAAALADIESRDSVRALLLTGAGRAFCAGQDLSDESVKSDASAADLAPTVELYNSHVRRLHALPIPVVCAVNGVAAGAGANLALACDFVLAARRAKFIQAFCKIGLIPDSGGTWMLPRLVGHARATALAMLGTPVRAEEACAWGMIHQVVEDGELEGTASGLCHHLAQQPTRGLAAIKRILQASWNNDLDTQLDLERDTQDDLGRSDDYREGVSAFFEKRAPTFRGC
jgi:2-(1,2-epoxy-1,2-dihydrophenyl)acetyl-CoA isomerase